MAKYQQIMEVAQHSFVEESGSVRMKIMEKEAKQLIKDDQKAKTQSRSPTPSKKLNMSQSQQQKQQTTFAKNSSFKGKSNDLILGARTLTSR